VEGLEASVHAGGTAGQPANQRRTPVKERILDTHGQAQDGDARNIINAWAGPRWLNDYRLACQLGGATTDEVIIRNLLLHLADSARMWLEHLQASQIHNWDDLVRTFVGNFQGTYVRPGNSWDLRSCTQKPGELLRDFIRHFSKRCTELPSVAQSEIVHAFFEGMTCRDLVRELGRSPPVDSNELFDIATSFASGEEVVGAIFDGKKGKRVDDVPA
jgi:hypothetical protein